MILPAKSTAKSESLLKSALFFPLRGVAHHLCIMYQEQTVTLEVTGRSMFAQKYKNDPSVTCILVVQCK